MVAAFANTSEFSVIISIDFVPKRYPRCVHTIRKIQMVKYVRKKIIGPMIEP